MKEYIIEYMLFGNFQSYKKFSFGNKPTKSECKIWLWNIINTYEKHYMDWDLEIEDIEIINIREYVETNTSKCDVGYINVNHDGICWVTKPSRDVKDGIPFSKKKNDSISC